MFSCLGFGVLRPGLCLFGEGSTRCFVFFLRIGVASVCSVSGLLGVIYFSCRDCDILNARAFEYLGLKNVVKALRLWSCVSCVYGAADCVFLNLSGYNSNFSCTYGKFAVNSTYRSDGFHVKDKSLQSFCRNTVQCASSERVVDLSTFLRRLKIPAPCLSHGFS